MKHWVLGFIGLSISFLACQPLETSTEEETLGENPYNHLNVLWGESCDPSGELQSELVFENTTLKTYQTAEGIYCLKLEEDGEEKMTAIGQFRTFFRPIRFLDADRVFYHTWCGTGCSLKGILNVSTQENFIISDLAGLELSPDEQWMLEDLAASSMAQDFTHYVRVTNLDTLQYCDFGAAEFPGEPDKNGMRQIVWLAEDQIKLTIIKTVEGEHQSMNEELLISLQTDCEEWTSLELRPVDLP